MFGLHALFTVNDKTLYASTEAANDLDTGFHIHIGEGKADQEENLRKYGMSAVERLHKAKGLGKKTLAIHCIHVWDKELDLIKETDTCVIHNPQSNMNNAVGVANIPKMLNKGILVGLGTDGMTPGMQDDVRTANILHKLSNSDPRVFFSESCQLLLENNAKIANRFFQDKIGTLEENALADIIILDYDPPTPLNESTFLGHFLFGICEAHVATTIINGKIVMKDGNILTLDEKEINFESRKQAEDFWKRF